LQRHLQLEKVSVATTLATKEKFKLQPHLQLKKMSVATTLATEKTVATALASEENLG
jgi:hypothetical protein